MSKIYYVSTNTFGITRNIGLKILCMIQSERLSDRLCYLDLSPIWDVYLPENQSVRLLDSLSLLGAKIYLRKLLDRLMLRVQLVRAKIYYSSLSRGAVEKALNRWRERTKNQSYDELLSVDMYGVPIIKLLSHDVALFLKVHDAYSADEALKEKIRGMAVAFLALNELLMNDDCFSQGNRFLAFEGYSLNSLIKLISRDAGGELVFFTAASHKNVSLDLVEFSSDTLPSRRRKKCQYWEGHRDQISLTSRLLNESFLDIETRLLKGGSHIYSPLLSNEHLVRSPHAELNIARNLPIVTVFTSSLDEFMATQKLQEVFSQSLPDEPQVFSDQVEMLRFLVAVANQKRNFCLVIRHHPRLGATKNGGQSQYYEKLCSPFAGVHSDYVRVVMPESLISSYWLIAWSSCIVNAWSNIGLEGLRLGVPTINVFSEHKSVCYWPQSIFPQNLSPESISEFIQSTIGSESITSSDKKRMVMAHSFYCFMNFSSYIRLKPLDQLSNGPVSNASLLLQAICDTNGWEYENFDGLSKLKWTEYREQSTASEIASGLMSLFTRKFPSIAVDTSICPLLLRLAKYQQVSSA